MNLWPSHNYRQHSRPARIAWIMGMINSGASIALLVTPNYFSNQQDYLDKSRWDSRQWDGRIERYVQLPDTLPIAELEKVARAWLPQGNRRSIEALADTANLSQKYLAAIEHAVKQANFYARQDGRDVADWPDVCRAIKGGALPSDSDLSAAVESAGGRKLSASGSRR